MTSKYRGKRPEGRKEIEKFGKRGDVISLEVSTHNNNDGRKTVTRK